MAAEGELERTLLARIAEARSAWPGLLVKDEVFGEAIRARLAASSPDAPERDVETEERTALAQLAGLRVADLYLAFGCAQGDTAALAHLERELMPAVRATLARLRYSPSQIDDALQSLREALVVSAPGEAPTITQYSGRGPLRSWLRVVAGHRASRIFHRPHDEVAMDDAAPELADVARDPELELLHRTYGSAVADATREALARLSRSERLLLKQRYRHHLDLEELAALHRAHVSTMSRRISRARERLVDGTREVMMERLGLTASEVLSVMRLVESGLDVTLSSVDERAG